MPSLQSFNNLTRLRVSITSEHNLKLLVSYLTVQKYLRTLDITFVHQKFFLKNQNLRMERHPFCIKLRQLYLSPTKGFINSLFNLLFTGNINTKVLKLMNVKLGRNSLKILNATYINDLRYVGQLKHIQNLFKFESVI